MPGPLIHSPTRLRPHLRRSPGGAGPLDSPALPPWHSAAGRVDRRGGKRTGPLTPGMSDPTLNCIRVVKEPFSLKPQQNGQFSLKKTTLERWGVRGRQIMTHSTGVTRQLSLNFASEAPVCTRVPNALGYKTSGSGLVGTGQDRAFLCPDFPSPVSHGGQQSTSALWKVSPASSSTERGMTLTPVPVWVGLEN